MVTETKNKSKDNETEDLAKEYENGICAHCYKPAKIIKPPEYLRILHVLQIANRSKGVKKLLSADEIGVRASILGYKKTHQLNELETTKCIQRPYDGANVFGILPEGVKVLKRWVQRGWDFSSEMRKAIEVKEKWFKITQDRETNGGGKRKKFLNDDERKENKRQKNRAYAKKKYDEKIAAERAAKKKKKKKKKSGKK